MISKRLFAKLSSDLYTRAQLGDGDYEDQAWKKDKDNLCGPKDMTNIRRINKPTNISAIVLLAALFLTPLSLVAKDGQLPELGIKDAGCFGVIPWLLPNENIKKGSTYDRLKHLNFSVRCLWLRDEEAVEKLDLTRAVDLIRAGWQSNPKKTVLMRIDFWGNGGKERYTGSMSPVGVYKRRIDAVLKQLEPVLHMLQGISLSEENIASAGRSAVLQDLYYHVKNRYPDLRVYQWWTPMTRVPGTYEEIFLPADGWVVDPYVHCRGMYGDKANIKRYVQKYLVTGKPLIFMPYATNHPKKFAPPFNMWNIIEEQLRLCEDFDLPVAWFWTYSKTNKSGGASYFGYPTGNELMDKISERVFAWSEYIKKFPDDYDGNPAVAEYWSNGPFKLTQFENNLIFEDQFQQSDFLDQSSGRGFRDLIWDGNTLKARGYKNRPTNVSLIYQFESGSDLRYPVISLAAQVEPSLQGKVVISLSSTRGNSWSHMTETKPHGNMQILQIDTTEDDNFKKIRKFWLKIDMKGDPGSDSKPPVRIDNLKIMSKKI